jgi:hypothetical protein
MLVSRAYADSSPLLIGEIMIKQKMVLRRLYPILATFFSLCLSVSSVSAWAFIRLAQEEEQKKERVIEKLSWPKEPVEIKAVKTKKGAIKLGQKFPEGDDWLSGLTLNISNTSNKAIVYVEIDIRFPRPKDENRAQEPSFVTSISYGSIPSSQAPPKRTTPIMPGETINIALPDDEYGQLKSSLIRHNFSASINRVQIIVRTVVFDDGMIWRGGQMMRPDPNDPDIWNPVEPSESGASKPNAERSRSRTRPRNGLFVQASLPLREKLKFHKMSFMNPPPLMQDGCIGRLYRTRTKPCPGKTSCTIREDYIDYDVYGPRVYTSWDTRECKTTSGSTCKEGFFPVTALVPSAYPCEVFAC